jgi:hypothetical protein
MKKLVAMLMVLAICAGQAGAVSVTRSKKSLIRTNDASGNPLQLESDKGWRVFESANSTSEAQVVDENGVAPTSGILHMVCVESRASSDVSSTYWAIVWDTAAATGGAAVTGRRLLPPLVRATDAILCQTLDAVFTLGLRVMNGVAYGSTYIYWRGLGDSR